MFKGKTLVEAEAALEVSRSLPHGHVALVHAMATRLGLAALLGPACRERDLAYALIISRVLRPRPKLSALAWWNDTTLGADLGVADANRDEVYAAMDWLGGRQDAIEAGRHLDDTDQPLHSFRGLPEHMATLTRNTITLGQTTFDKSPCRPDPAQGLRTDQHPNPADPEVDRAKPPPPANPQISPKKHAQDHESSG